MRPPLCCTSSFTHLLLLHLNTPYPPVSLAEYAEARPELAAGMSKKDATLRSASVRFEVQPGQPVTLR